MSSAATPEIVHQRARPVSRAALGGRELGEEAVQRAVVSHLEHRGVPGVVWFHVPNGGSRSRAEAGVFRALGTKAGVPDILLFHRGRAYGLELKRERGGRRSPAPSEMHAQLRAAGVEVAVAYGLDEALEQLKLWALLR